MGAGANKKNNDIQSKTLSLFNKVTTYLDELNKNLQDFSNASFSTVEEMKTLQVKQEIDLLQNNINEELILVRKIVKEQRNQPIYHENEKRLNEISAKSQELYISISLVIKSKIKTND